MKKLLSLSLVVFFISAVSFNLQAQTLGAELYYVQTQPGQYSVYLINYLSANEKPHNDFQYVKVFEKMAKGSSNDLRLNLQEQTEIMNNAPTPCGAFESNITKAVYSGSITLNNVIGGYDIIWNFNNLAGEFVNVKAEPETGFSLNIHIPEMKVGEMNSSPVFVESPFVFLCSDIESLSMQIAADSIDNDKVKISLTKPYTSNSLLNNGRRQIGPENTILIDNLPYKEFEYKTGFDYKTPFGSDSEKINPETGYYMITPSQPGNYIFSISATDYRNGEMLSSSQRVMIVHVVE